MRCWLSWVSRVFLFPCCGESNFLAKTSRDKEEKKKRKAYEKEDGGMQDDMIRYNMMHESIFGREKGEVRECMCGGTCRGKAEHEVKCGNKRNRDEGVR